jgi:TIR domain
MKVAVRTWLQALESDDVFISYSRFDGDAYVTGIDAALSARGFSCFSDKRGTDAHPLPPETLYSKVRRCRTLVLLGTPGAVSRPEHITPEVREFAAANGTSRIIPISFDRGSDLMDWSVAPWHGHIVGKARERESAEALTTGEPRKEIVDNIVAVSNYMKANDRLRLYRRNAFMTFVALLLASLGAAGVALWFSAHARRAGAEAERQQAIAEARALANQSQSVLREHPDRLATSIDLAIAGMAKATEIGVPLGDVDAALRQSVAHLPRPMGRQRFRGALTSPTVTADGLHFAALDGRRLRIYRIGYAAPVKDVACEQGEFLVVSNDVSVAAMEVDRSAVVIYHLNSGRRVRIRTPARTPESEFTLQAMVLSPTGRFLATLAITGRETGKWVPDESYTLTVWDTRTGRRLGDPSMGVGWIVRDVTFARDGDLVVAKSGEGDPSATIVS